MNPAHKRKIANRQFRRLKEAIREERRQMRNLTPADQLQHTHEKVAVMAQKLKSLDGDSFRVWAARYKGHDKKFPRPLRGK